jgi:hypothetical protein
MRFDPDTHRAHSTFESAVRARHGDPLDDEPRRVVVPVAVVRSVRLDQTHAESL